MTPERLTPERFAEIKALLVEVAALSTDSRARRLEEVEERDADLAEAVRKLLLHESEFAEVTSPLVPLAGSGATETAPPVPGQIGPYEILEELGEGGMGVVYRARQEQPFRREVALKLIRSGFASAHVRQRFDRERRALARMDHPNIARVLDLGTDGGRPYFVMELVRGRPLLEYCDAAKLGLRPRLGLFLQVVSAVQHAHQKGILHRDLKPGNVLVSVDEGSTPACKVIDFGIAKVIEISTDDEEGGDTLGASNANFETTVHQVLGTPEYMSPEQAGGGSADIDTRSDVFQLGVLLHELLLGVRPLDETQLANLDYLDVLQHVRNQNPPRPSRRWERMETSRREEAASRRSTTPTRLERSLRGDLDWILLRCLDRDRNQRYGSAAELGADLLRHLADEPVSAGPPSAGYRIRKFTRRHRAAVTAAALTAGSLLIGIATTTWQAQKAQRERLRTEQTLDEVGRFANDVLFDLYDEIRDIPGSTQAREQFAENLVDYLGELSLRAHGETQLRGPLSVGFARLADVQSHLGNLDEAVDAAERSIQLAKEDLSESPDSWSAAAELARRYESSGNLFASLGRIEDALQRHRQAILFFEQAAELSGSSGHGLASELDVSRRHCAFLLLRMGRPEEALVLSTEVVNATEARARQSPDDSGAQSDLALAHAFRAEALDEMGRDEEALAGYEAAAEILGENYRRDPSSERAALRYGVILGAVSAALLDLGREESALAAAEEALRVREERASRSPEHRHAQMELCRGLQQVGRIQTALGYWDEAGATLERAVRLVRGAVAEEPENVSAERVLVGVVLDLAELRHKEGRHALSLEHLNEVEERSSRLTGIEPERNDHLWNRLNGALLAGDVVLATIDEGSLVRREERESWSHARSWFRRAVEAVDSLQVRGWIDDGSEEAAAAVRGVARCDSALATN